MFRAFALLEFRAFALLEELRALSPREDCILCGEEVHSKKKETLRW